MTYSPLINETIPPTGKVLINGRLVDKWSSRPANVVINGLNVHHHATTGTGGITRLTTGSEPASANYIIRNNGSLIGSVPEEYRAWTTSSYAADDDKITVEIQNESGAPEWRISDAAMDTLIRLYADLGKRYKFATSRGNIFGHRQYVATLCPGDYTYNRLTYVAAEATKINTPEEFLMALSPEEQKAILWNVRQIKKGIDELVTTLKAVLAALNK